MSLSLKTILLKMAATQRLRYIRIVLRNVALYDERASPCEPGGGAGAHVTVVFLALKLADYGRLHRALSR